MTSLTLQGRRFVVPAPVLCVAEDGTHEIAGLIPAAETRVGDDIMFYDMSTDAVDLSPVAAGRVPLLREHFRNLDSLMGALTAAWFDGPVLCLIGRLVDAPDVDRIWAMMTAGLPVAISLGAEVIAAEPTGPSPWGGQRYVVREWRLSEVSFCLVGKNLAAHAVRLDSPEGRAMLATRPPSDHDTARQRLRLDAWQAWAPGAAYRIAEQVGADPHRLGELLREEVDAHGERLIA